VSHQGADPSSLGYVATKPQSNGAASVQCRLSEHAARLVQV
jgi:hypothetical protein